MDNDFKEILKKVRRIDVRTRRLANDALAGRFHSVFRGRGMDFDEVREYTPGDEVRTIDWNVTARAGRPFVKKYREERELTILLAVDVSGSGDFGSASRTKREVEAEVACVLALSAVRNNDRVGLLSSPITSRPSCHLAKAGATCCGWCTKCCRASQSTGAPTWPRPSIISTPSPNANRWCSCSPTFRAPAT